MKKIPGWCLSHITYCLCAQIAEKAELASDPVWSFLRWTKGCNTACLQRGKSRNCKKLGNLLLNHDHPGDCSSFSLNDRAENGARKWWLSQESQRHESPCPRSLCTSPHSNLCPDYTLAARSATRLQIWSHHTVLQIASLEMRPV